VTGKRTSDAGTSTGRADASTQAQDRVQTLSPRQRQVLELVATGASANAIAEQLAINPSTVKHHLSFAYHKLGVSNRVEATRVYLLATEPAMRTQPPSTRRRQSRP
jgi:DNA-binding NarL/FixJ family response regulator